MGKCVYSLDRAGSTYTTASTTETSPSGPWQATTPSSFLLMWMVQTSINLLRERKGEQATSWSLTWINMSPLNPVTFALLTPLCSSWDYKPTSHTATHIKPATNIFLARPLPKTTAPGGVSKLNRALVEWRRAWLSVLIVKKYTTLHVIKLDMVCVLVSRKLCCIKS